MQRRSRLPLALALAAFSLPLLPAAWADPAVVAVPLAAHGDEWDERIHWFYHYEDGNGTVFADDNWQNGTAAHGAAVEAEDMYGEGPHDAFKRTRSFEEVSIFRSRYGDKDYGDRYEAQAEETVTVDLLTRSALQVTTTSRLERDSPATWNVAPGVEVRLPLGSHAAYETRVDEWRFGDRDLLAEAVQGRALAEGDAWQHDTVVYGLGATYPVTIHLAVTHVDQSADPPRATVAASPAPGEEPFREAIFEDGFPLPVWEGELVVVEGNDTHAHHGAVPYRVEYGFFLDRTPRATGATPIPFGACAYAVHFHARNPGESFHPLGAAGPEGQEVLSMTIADVLAEAEASDDAALAEYQEWKEDHPDAWVYDAWHERWPGSWPGVGPWSESSFWWVRLAAADGTGFGVNRWTNGVTFPPSGDASWSADPEEGVPTLTPEQRAGLELVSLDMLADLAAERGHSGDPASLGFHLFANARTDGDGETHVDASAFMTLGYREGQVIGLTDDPTRGPFRSTSDIVYAGADPLYGARWYAFDASQTYYPLAPMPPDEWLPAP